MKAVHDIVITELQQTPRSFGQDPTANEKLNVDLGYEQIFRAGERPTKEYYSRGYGENAEKLFFTDEQLNEVAVPFDEIIVQISYPLTQVANFFLQQKGGFTLRQLIDVCSDLYHYVYDKEDETTKVPAKLGHQGGAAPVFNRCQTNGRYGIWGHVIDDLIMHTLCHLKFMSRLEVAILEGVSIISDTIHFFDVVCDS